MNATYAIILAVSNLACFVAGGFLVYRARTGGPFLRLKHSTMALPDEMTVNPRKPEKC